MKFEFTRGDINGQLQPHTRPRPCAVGRSPKKASSQVAEVLGTPTSLSTLTKPPPKSVLTRRGCERERSP